MSVIFDPAQAIAASRCLMARSLDREKGRTAAHDRPCGWCDYPLDYLVKLVAGFNEWAGHDPRDDSYRRLEVRLFTELPREDQDKLIVEAQELKAPVRADAEAEPGAADDADWKLL